MEEFFYETLPFPRKRIKEKFLQNRKHEAAATETWSEFWGKFSVV